MPGLFGNFFNPSSGTPHNAPPNPPARPGQTNLPNANPQQVLDPNSNQQNPQGTPSNQQATPPASPLDKFTELWHPKKNEKGEPVAPAADPLRQPVFNFDPAKIQATADQMDFTGGVDPELVTKALGGDATAFSDVINQAIRTAVVGMTVNSGNLINTALASNNERITAQLPTHIKKHQLQQQSPDDNPVFNHPAAQPLVQTLKQLALAKDPNANVADINMQIAQYLTGLSEAVLEADPTRVKVREAQKPKEQDFSIFLKDL